MKLSDELITCLFIRQTEKKNLFFFNCTIWDEFVDKIGETNWWRHLMNSLMVLNHKVIKSRGFLARHQTILRSAIKFSLRCLSVCRCIRWLSSAKAQNTKAATSCYRLCGSCGTSVSGCCNDLRIRSFPGCQKLETDWRCWSSSRTIGVIWTVHGRCWRGRKIHAHNILPRKMRNIKQLFFCGEHLAQDP